MNVLGWIGVGVIAFNVIFIGTLLVVFLHERRGK